MKTKSLFFLFLISALLCVGFYRVYAAPEADWIAVSAPQETIPPNITSTTNKPMMMLASSKDHTLFAPIYTDYEDIDGDGTLDVTFKPNFKYYGYFDSTKCYKYQNDFFDPIGKASVFDGRYVCSEIGKSWSGNFLNWATMTRVDVIRKMLYGGKRYKDGYQDGVDGVSVSILERVNLSKDAHSFTKHYAGEDIRDYTPFTKNDLVKSTGDNQNLYAGLTLCNRSSEMSAGGIPQIRLAKGNYKMWSTINGDVCRWKDEAHYWGIWNDAPYYYLMQGTFGPKLARYFLSKDKGDGGIAHESALPLEKIDGISYDGVAGDLTARVRVCVPGLIGEERCQPFPVDSNKNLKPYGIFQEFGFKNSSGLAKAEFGVITGSYSRNLQAGILRKNMGDFSDEINNQTGVFCHSENSGCDAVLADGRKTDGGAIKALDAMALFQRGLNDYDGSGTKLPAEMGNGGLVIWGNPIGEMVVQALNYYAGTTSSNPADINKELAYKVPVAAWRDPLSSKDKDRVSTFGNPICRPLYLLALSSSALSFDADAGVDFKKLPNRKLGLIEDYVNTIGDQEKISNTFRSVGSVSGANSFGSTCAKKEVGRLSDVSGICPEAPATGGTYQVAGASWYANTSMIRDISALGVLPLDFYSTKDILKVKTMAASLAGGVPRVEIPIPNQPGKYVYITPEVIFNAETKMMPGGILSFNSIKSGTLMDSSNTKKIGSYGSFVVSFNDKLFGGDYDMDATGFLRYEVTPDESALDGFVVTIKTDIVNVGGGFASAYGFSIIGTDRDGRYLTHQHASTYGGDDPEIYGYKAFKKNNLEGYMCGDIEKETVGSGRKGNRCYVSANSDNVHDEDYLYEMKFKMQGVDNVILKDPLWYAAKYGYFDSSVKNADGSYVNVTLPTEKESWDKFSADGVRSADDIPDGFFLARRPEILEDQLRKALNVLASTSNVSTALSTPVLVDGSIKYAVKFDSVTIDGRLEAYQAQKNASFSASPIWEAGEILQKKSNTDQGQSREIITNDNGRGVPFRWNQISEIYKTQLTTASTNKLSENNAHLTLDYIRGDQRKEGDLGLRQRVNGLLGPIVNSAPWVQGPANANWGSVAGYADFYNSQRKRKSVLWVGSNDGMLHAFNAETGEEIFAYIPGALANRLAEIPLQRSGRTKLDGADFVSGLQMMPSGTVWPYVDGNVYSADVKVGSDWRTYVLGALGRGGRGVFALDATSIDRLKESEAAQIFKWQFTAADDKDLGYQTGDINPAHRTSNQASPVVRLNNGKFALLIGNGQRSLTGRAVLFILYMDGPDSTSSWTGRYRKIVVDAGSGNGLATPHWEDLNGDGTADVVYAGDLKGNVWKFDLSSANAVDWAPAFGAEATATQAATPLFTAKGSSGAVQPISTAPEVIYMARGGVLVNVATGNAFSSGDFGVGTPVQSVYGVWDRGLPIADARWMRRKYSRTSDGLVVASAGTDTMDWSQYSGWAVDLPGGGEAVLSDPIYDAGVLTFVSTRPKEDGNQCNNQPANTLYVIDPISGLPERNTQGSILVDGGKYWVAGKAIADPKVRVVGNRRTAPQVACAAGDPGCVCKEGDCSKAVPQCGPGQRAVSVLGKTTDATVCYNVAPRLHWREVSGMRTYPN